jgi:hypothetical protein
MTLAGIFLPSRDWQALCAKAHAGANRQAASKNVVRVCTPPLANRMSRGSGFMVFLDVVLGRKASEGILLQNPSATQPIAPAREPNR